MTPVAAIPRARFEQKNSRQLFARLAAIPSSRRRRALSPFQFARKMFFLVPWLETANGNDWEIVRTSSLAGARFRTRRDDLFPFRFFRHIFSFAWFWDLNSRLLTRTSNLKKSSKSHKSMFMFGLSWTSIISQGYVDSATVSIQHSPCTVEHINIQCIQCILSSIYL